MEITLKMMQNVQWCDGQVVKGQIALVHSGNKASSAQMATGDCARLKGSFGMVRHGSLRRSCICKLFYD